jgi:hypothetical protein
MMITNSRLARLRPPAPPAPQRLSGGQNHNNPSNAGIDFDQSAAVRIQRCEKRSQRPFKIAEQHDLEALHRVREAMGQQRTAIIVTLSSRVAALLQRLPESSLPVLIQIKACLRAPCQLWRRCARTVSGQRENQQMNFAWFALLGD